MLGTGLNLAQYKKTSTSSRHSENLKINVDSTEQTTCDPIIDVNNLQTAESQSPVKIDHRNFCHQTPKQPKNERTPPITIRITENKDNNDKNDTDSQNFSKKSFDDPFKPSTKTFRTPAPSHKSSNASHRDLSSNSNNQKLNFENSNYVPNSMASPIKEENNSFELAHGLNTSGPVMSAYDQLENRPVLKQAS